MIQVTYMEKGKFPNLFMAYMVNTCFHCANPPCIQACPAEAISKRVEDGLVTVDRKKCLKCHEPFCLDACPYDSPKIINGENKEMQKCDFCLGRINKGKQPICVAACPMRALDYGDIEKLAGIKGDIREAPGFNYLSEVKPNILFKPRRQILNIGNNEDVPMG